MGVQTLAASLIVYGLAALLVGGGLWGYGAWKYHDGETAGIAAERAAWHEKLRLAAIAQAAETKSKQADIDAAAQAYIDQQRSDQVTIAALEQALLREKKDQDNVAPDATAKPAICRPAGISAGVSTRLDAVGRQPAAKAGRAR
ncbi:MAG: hypothetical protein EOQ52_20325 [Mesorhizobium sp.]|uniref:hypothetical protein n=1 Tax=Mesorhizobium sp. TaxID=1871066 RepID=UPI000FE5BD05|nr:hypothetical protein [Mesorhizobium sp.]RWB85901.1 MAG: hypothetical protein EOQ52_20325 [Mesorhizobium sp.]